MVLNCGTGEESWESLGQEGDQTSQSLRKSTLNTHWKDWCWSWSSNTLATWCEELTHLKRPWCCERLRAGEGGDRMRWLDVISDSMDMSLSKLQEIAKDREAWFTAVHGVSKRLNNNKNILRVKHLPIFSGCIQNFKTQLREMRKYGPARTGNIFFPIAYRQPYKRGENHQGKSKISDGNNLSAYGL